jgi:hypothetical protein
LDPIEYDEEDDNSEASYQRWWALQRLEPPSNKEPEDNKQRRVYTLNSGRRATLPDTRRPTIQHPILNNLEPTNHL